MVLSEVLSHLVEERAIWLMNRKGCSSLNLGTSSHHRILTNICSIFHTEALKFFKKQLSSYEQSEILGYTELWFLGLEAEKLHMAPEKFSKTSFDDEHGSYMKVMGQGFVETGFGVWGLGTRDSMERKRAWGILQHLVPVYLKFWVS